MGSAATPLQVGIIGAGIAGLSAGIALAQAGHNVEIFEKSNFNNEIGAAINVCPNASRVLARWGFKFEEWEPTVAKMVKVMLPDGKIVHQESYAEIPVKYGSPYLFFHRVDLHTGLKLLATHSGCVIRTGADVVDLDCETGSISLKGGSHCDKDVVVIADGVHSRFVSLINADVAPPAKTGSSIYRWLLSTDELRADPKTLPFFDSAADQGLTVRVADPETRIVHYPCRNGKTMNFVGIHPESRHSQSGELVEDFHASGNIEDLERIYSSLGESVIEVCRKAKDLKLWPLIFREPLEKWHRGKAILIGDAAHPMLPHQGQGGSQAIEDGAALGVILAGLKAGDDTNHHLALVEDVRKWRASTVQYMSNAGQEQADETAEKVRQVIRGREPPKTYDEIHDFNFGYDVVKESKAALANI